MNLDHILTDFVGDGWIKRHHPQTERQLILDLKADLTYQRRHNSKTDAFTQLYNDSHAETLKLKKRQNATYFVLV